MDILKKSTLAVVVVTAIASGMILFTGNIVADNKSQSEPDEVTALSGIETLSISRPPPGPFSNTQVLSAPKAPKKPTNSSVQPMQLAKPIGVTSMPQSPSKVEEKKAKPNKPSLVSEPLQPQNTNKNIPAAPKNIMKQPDIGKQPRFNPTNQPIWMQRGNIVPKGIDASKNMNQENGNASNGQNQNYMGMPNMGWNSHQPQQYMYVPVPMMQFNGLPPQMPMFNKNINPPQNSWMPNPLNNMPATQEKIAPVQKEIK